LKQLYFNNIFDFNLKNFFFSNKLNKNSFLSNFNYKIYNFLEAISINSFTNLAKNNLKIQYIKNDFAISLAIHKRENSSSKRNSIKNLIAKYIIEMH